MVSSAEFTLLLKNQSVISYDFLWILVYSCPTQTILCGSGIVSKPVPETDPKPQKQDFQIHEG